MRGRSFAWLFRLGLVMVSASYRIDEGAETGTCTGDRARRRAQCRRRGNHGCGADGADQHTTVSAGRVMSGSRYRRSILRAIGFSGRTDRKHRQLILREPGFEQIGQRFLGIELVLEVASNDAGEGTGAGDVAGNAVRAAVGGGIGHGCSRVGRSNPNSTSRARKTQRRACASEDNGHAR